MIILFFSRLHKMIILTFLPEGGAYMVRGAVLVSGDGGQLQAILDSIYFKELPEFELIAVISTSRDAYAMKRAASAHVPAHVVDPELFPTAMSHSIAIATKLKDMDIDLVILDEYTMPLGVIPFQFRGKVISSMPALYPAFDQYEGDIYKATIKRGLRVTGGTVYLCDNDGGVGTILGQKAIDVVPGESAETLQRKIMEDCFWKLLPAAVLEFCSSTAKQRRKK